MLLVVKNDHSKLKRSLDKFLRNRLNSSLNYRDNRQKRLYEGRVRFGIETCTDEREDRIQLLFACHIEVLDKDRCYVHSDF